VARDRLDALKYRESFNSSLSNRSFRNENSFSLRNSAAGTRILERKWRKSTNQARTPEYLKIFRKTELVSILTEFRQRNVGSWRQNHLWKHFSNRNEVSNSNSTFFPDFESLQILFKHFIKHCSCKSQMASTMMKLDLERIIFAIVWKVEGSLNRFLAFQTKEFKICFQTLKLFKFYYSLLFSSRPKNWRKLHTRAFGCI
jgi:hypothetical protein